MAKFIEFESEYGSSRKPFKSHIRADDILCVTELIDEPNKAAVRLGDISMITVNGTPAEVLAKIEAAEAEPVRAATTRVEDLQVGDELEIGGHRMAFKWVRRDGDLAFSNISGRPNDLHAPQSQIAEMLARGVIVRRDGEVISGWPV